MKTSIDVALTETPVNRFTRGPVTPLHLVLREARENANFTQQEIANMIGISLWAYSRIETGKQKRSLSFDSFPIWIKKLPMKVRLPLINASIKYIEHKIIKLNNFKVEVKR